MNFRAKIPFLNHRFITKLEKVKHFMIHYWDVRNLSCEIFKTYVPCDKDISVLNHAGKKGTVKSDW